MSRIRTIKPEFSQSESMGRMTRDARLLFVLLWTLADDEGRLRGNSKYLCGQLFPYDDDVRSSIDSWIDELIAEDCIVRYSHGGSQYIQIREWAKHQKIDRPTKSRFPAPPVTASRGLDEDSAHPREDSSKAREGSTSSQRGLDEDSSLDLDLDLDLGPINKGARASEPVEKEDLNFLTHFPNVTVPKFIRDDPQWMDWLRKWFAHLLEKSRRQPDKAITEITVQNHIDELAGRQRDRCIEVISYSISSHAWKLYWDYKPPPPAITETKSAPRPKSKNQEYLERLAREVENEPS